jgi:hypothetical protein
MTLKSILLASLASAGLVAADGLNARAVAAGKKCTYHPRPRGI